MSTIDPIGPFVRLRAIYDTLRVRRPDTYAEEFRTVLETLTEIGPSVANAHVRELLGDDGIRAAERRAADLVRSYS